MSKKSKIGAYLRLMRFDKPIGTFLLLWPTLWGLWVAAQGVPSWHILAVFIGGVVLMRAAGCTINDFADRNIDGHVERTKERPLVTGEISATAAVFLFILLSLLAFSLVLTLNRLTVYFSFVAVALAFMYPFAKRVISMPQIVLGAAFAWSIPMAFTAITESVPNVAWLLYIATLLWTVAYDTMYAMVDREYDKTIGVKSTAILFGQADVAMVISLHVLAAIALVFVGIQLEFAWSYFIALGVSWLLVLYQIFLIKDRDPERCFRAFLSNNWYGLLVFVGIAVAYMLMVPES